MELKWCVLSHSTFARARSNRTFMELKCLDEVKKQTGAWGSNRTFMELK